MTSTPRFVTPEIREILILHLDKYNTNCFQDDTDVQNLISYKNPLRDLK